MEDIQIQTSLTSGDSESSCDNGPDVGSGNRIRHTRTADCRIRQRPKIDESCSVKRVLFQQEAAKRRYFEIKLLEIALRQRKQTLAKQYEKDDLKSVNKLFKDQPYLFDNVKFEFEFKEQRDIRANEGLKNSARYRATSARSAPPSRRSNRREVELHSCQKPSLPVIAPDTPPSDGGIRVYGYASRTQCGQNKKPHHRSTPALNKPDVKDLAKKFPFVKFDQIERNDIYRRDTKYTRMEASVCEEPTDRQFVLITNSLPIYKKSNIFSSRYRSALLKN